MRTFWQEFPWNCRTDNINPKKHKKNRTFHVSTDSNLHLACITSQPTHYYNCVISIVANCVIVGVFDTPTQLQQTNYYTSVRVVSGIHALFIAPIRALGLYLKQCSRACIPDTTLTGV